MSSSRKQMSKRQREQRDLQRKRKRQEKRPKEHIHQWRYFRYGKECVLCYEMELRQPTPGGSNG